MPVRIVDASALGALVFGEPKAEEVARSLSNGPLVAPPLLWFEVASICFHKLRIYPKQKERILEAFKLGRFLPIEIAEVDHSAVIQLAMETNLTTYDANYLWLTIHLSGELITLDKKLRNAADVMKKRVESP